MSTEKKTHVTAVPPPPADSEARPTRWFTDGTPHRETFAHPLEEIDEVLRHMRLAIEVLEHDGDANPDAIRTLIESTSRIDDIAAQLRSER